MCLKKRKGKKTLTNYKLEPGDGFLIDTWLTSSLSTGPEDVVKVLVSFFPLMSREKFIQWHKMRMPLDLYRKGLGNCDFGFLYPPFFAHKVLV